MNINFRVTNQKLVRTSFEQIVENSINYLFCNFEFSEDWNECSKNAYFSQNGTIWYVSEVNDENICEIPIEVIKHTGFRMYLVARDVNNNMKITTNIINLNVELSGNGEGEKPSITDINSDTLNIERQGNIIKIEIDGKYTTDEELQNAINELETSINEKLTNYYTKSEVDEIKTNINEKINNEKQELTNTIESVNSTLNSRIDNLSSSQEKALENAINDVKNDTANTYTTKVEYNTHKIEFENFVKNVNVLLSSDDTTLDTLQEIVNYIKNNKDLLDGITINKINYSDIVDNLETALINKVLSANQGVMLKQLIDELNNSKVNKETVGQLNNLTTTNKSNIVESINEVNTKQNVLQPQKPKETYENLSALQTAYPNGASGVYLTSDDGHWYYWDGTQYVDGGVYQASEIADGSITSEKLSDGSSVTTNYTLKEIINNSVENSSITEFSGQAISIKNRVVESNGYLEIYGYFQNERTIKILELSKDNDTYTVINLQEKNVIAGFNNIITNLQVSKGNYIGIIVPTGTLYFTNHSGDDYHLYINAPNPNVLNVATGSTYSNFINNSSVVFLFDFRIIANSNSCIDTQHINDYAITSKKIADGAITLKKLNKKVTSQLNLIKRANISSLLRTATTTINIKLIGDSITYGVGSTDRTTTSWAGLLKNHLESKFNCSVTNNGISGATSQKLIDNISTLIDDTDNIVICMIGTNNRDGVTLFNNLYNHYVQISEYCEERNIKFIPMACIPASLTDDSARNKHMEDINHIITSFAYDYSYELINLYEDFYNYCLIKGITLDSLLADNLHPNDDGYYVIFRLICKALGVVAKIKEATW